MTGKKLTTLVDEHGRVCTQCGVYKTWDLFYKRKRPHGLQYYYNNCKDCFRLKSYPASARKRKSLKKEIISYYGGRCACCGESEIIFLTMDHVDNNGAEHRREAKISSGLDFYYWLRRNGYPEGFQVLCWNCNTGKHINGGVCPHMSVLV